MAYYTSAEVLEFSKKNLTELKSKGLPPLNLIEKIEKQITSQEDLVACYWFEIKEEEPCVEGKTFARIDSDLYCDDRLAIDMVTAQRANCTLKEVIAEREKYTKIAERYQQITPDKAEELKTKVLGYLKKKEI